MIPLCIIISLVLIPFSLAQNLNEFKGSPDIRGDLKEFISKEKAAEIHVWLRPVSERCKRDYAQFEEHFRDPLLGMGRNNSQLWAPKSKTSSVFKKTLQKWRQHFSNFGTVTWLFYKANRFKIGKVLTPFLYMYSTSCTFKNTFTRIVMVIT